MTDARHVHGAAVAQTDRHRGALDAAKLEFDRLARIVAESERLESEALAALCAQSLQATKVTT